MSSPTAPDIQIRPYAESDQTAWMRAHAIIMSISHAWNYAIQERPDYAGHRSTRLVAEVDGALVGLTDIEYDNEPGEICFLKDSPGGYVLEFGRLPEFAGLGLGDRLIKASIEDAQRLGVRRLEYWSQDRAAQRFYRRYGMTEIGRHYRFRFKPPVEVVSEFARDGIGVEYVYGACTVEEWPLVKQRYEVLEKHPLEPHLCVGFEIRF
ncbi:MAG: GNAT family N-acetyltransferase [Candidatus Hydrogenedens sp.]|nr:GNAT family N-acetyltransferase [Candidatus Hydrogenedens sp.]